MPKTEGVPARLARIADQIQRELADLIRFEVRDPRVRFVTLTAVEIARDQSHARVFFTVMGPETEAGEVLSGLERASGFLRTSLAHRLSTRSVPALEFVYDESIERGARLTRLIDEAVNAPAPAPAPEPKPRARRSPRK
jgi:ribosome-binding factor A